MFEAIHGSAPTIAGKGIANPSGLLHGAIMMLVHIGQGEIAAKIHNAWLCTIEAGVHTGDIYKDDVSKKKVGTEEFADAVIERLGGSPHLFKKISYLAAPLPIHSRKETQPVRKKKELVGVDVFLDWDKGSADDLGKAIEQIATDGLKLTMISNRGARVYPNGLPETFCTDHWRCRYVSTSGNPISHDHILQLLGKLRQAGYDFVQTENLCTFDGKPGYSMGQGE
jgi:isocitrate dehydrogenase